MVWRLAQEQNGIVVESAYDAYNAMANFTCVAGKTKDVNTDVDYWKHIDSKNEEEMKCQVALYGPLYISMYFDPLDNYKSGIWDDPLDECPTDGSFNHAITIVGYGTEAGATGELLDYWLIQNS
jgi:C1A family cysteine protease